MTAVSVELTIVGLLILLNGALALAEMAIVSSRKARLQQRAETGDRGARVALELADQPNQFLSTLQVGITLVGILAGAFGGATLSQVIAAQVRQVQPLVPYAEALGLGLVVLAITYLTLIFGELVPKRLALNDPERIASLVAIPMRALSRLAAPLVHLLSNSTELVLRLLGVRPAEEAPVTEQEITIMIEQGRKAGVFEKAEQELVESVFRLGERRVSSLMTPRPEIVWLEAAAPSDQVLATVLASRHARFPVCRGNLDEVVGIAAARDILAALARGEPLDPAVAAKPALFMPELVPAFELLELFRAQGTHLALAVDEFGGVSGLVTVTDLLEAIVGDLPSREEASDPDVVQRDDGSWLVDGTVPIEEVKELLRVDELPGEAAGDFYSLGGMLMQNLGRIPAAGDHFDWQGRRFEVVDMDGNRIDKVLISPTPAKPES